MPSFVVRAICDSLRVYCRFGLRANPAAAGAAGAGAAAAAWVVDADGCDAVLALGDVAAHEATCGFKILTCAHGPRHGLPPCGVQFRRREQATHDDACAMRPMPCAHGCDALMPPAMVLSALAHGGADAEHAIAALAARKREDGMCAHTAAAMCDALLRTMEASISHLGVQREACALLVAFTLNETRYSLAVTALVGAVLAALAAHPEAEDLHEEACGALGTEPC
jgi:hypothetical protein